MRRLVISIIVLLGFIFCGYSQKKQDCSLQIKLSKEKLDKFKGDYFYIKKENPVDSIDTPIVLDSVKVEKLLTRIEGLKIMDNSLNIAELFIGNKIKPIVFVIDKGVVSIDLTEDEPRIGGTSINSEMFDFNNLMGSLVKDAKKNLKAIPDSISKEDRAKRRDEIIEKVNKELDSISKNYLDKHKNDAIGLSALLHLLYSENYSDKRGLISSTGKLVQKQKPVLKFLESLDNLEKTQEGRMFRDFSGKNDKNEDVRLSDYVGKGHYTLVDFWASWCGPCRREIPNIIKVYNKYKSYNLDVVGVAVWDKMQDHLDAVKSLGIKYPQILNESEATKLYGINGIPQIILFDPDGKIVKRDLRGDEIHKLLDEKFGIKNNSDDNNNPAPMVSSNK